MTQVSGAWLENKGTQAVFQAFEAAGFEIFTVGGCVRDAQRGMEPSDVDFATNATPDQIVELAKKVKFKAILTGIDHGTITLVVHGVVFEVTTYRKDVVTDGRHAVVAFSGAMTDDARRRDFTMNALYADKSGHIIDPLNGLPDLMAGRVRFIGDPNLRIKEDYLRILRFFRFFALFGSVEEGIDADGLAACAAHLDGLEGLSKHRVGVEMRKLLAAENPAPACAAMAGAGVLARVLPGASVTVLAILVHMESVTGIDPNWLTRLAILGGENTRGNLNLSNVETRQLEVLKTAIGDNSTLDAIAYKHGASVAADVALSRAAIFQSEPPIGFQEAINRAAAMKFPIRAADLMPDLHGPDLGLRLKTLEARWIASDFTLTKSELLG